jgi:glycosyltransferase involved in cell wall biosynthesis
VRIAHVITGLEIGGAELQLRKLIAHSRHSADVFALYNAGIVADMLREDGVRVTDLKMKSNRQVGAVGRLTKLLRDGSYDVVHVHLYRACIYGRLAAHRAGVPRIITTEHSIGDTHIEGRRKTAGVRALYLMTDRLSDVDIAVSTAVADRLIAWGVPAAKIRVIANGVDFPKMAFDEQARQRIRAEFGIPADAIVVGGVGRLHSSKHFELLVEAAAPLLNDDRRLLIVGDGPEREALARQASDLGVIERLVLAGARTDVAELMSAMDVFVSPAPQEAFGLAVVEALASGLPSVYAQCPALDAFDVPNAAHAPGGAPALRAAIKTWLDQPPARQVPPEVADAYSFDAMSRMIDDIYEGLPVSALSIADETQSLGQALLQSPT